MAMCRIVAASVNEGAGHCRTLVRSFRLQRKIKYKSYVMGFVRRILPCGGGARWMGCSQNKTCRISNSVSVLDLFLLLGTQHTFQNQISRFAACFCTLKVNGMWPHGVCVLVLLNALSQT